MTLSDLLRQPSEHNIAWSWVTTLIPSDYSSPFGLAMGIFTSTLLYIGSLFLAWQVILGIVSSAYSGKVLGDKFHQIWAPVRVVIGIGLLIPIAGSFSSGHYLIRDVVARAGINLADNVWISFVGQAQKTPMVPPVKNGLKLALDIYEAEICAVYKNFWFEEAYRRTKPIATPAAMGKRDDKFTTWRYGDCGYIAMPMLEKFPDLNLKRQIAIGKIVVTAREDVKPFASHEFNQENVRSPANAWAYMSDGLLPRLADKIKNLAKEYDDTIVEAVGETLKNDAEGKAINDLLYAKAKQEGFITAGLYFTYLADQSQRILAITDVKHQHFVTHRNAVGKSNLESAQHAISAFRIALFAEEQEIAADANDYAFASDQDGNFLTRLTAGMTRDLAEWMATKKGSAGDSTVQQIAKSSPISDQVQSGHMFMTIATGAILAAFIPITAAFTGAGWAVGSYGAALWAMGWMSPVIGILWTVGAVRAYVLPILPFMYMFLFASIWLLAVVEALIALGVWALSWIRMDGDDLVAQGSKIGTMLIYQVFLMPALGVLAFCAAFILLPLIIGGVDVLWARAFYAQSGGYPTGLTSIIVNYVLITMLTMYLSIHVLGQIFNIPNRIIVWAGGQGHEAGDRGMAAAMAMAAAGTLGRGMPGLPKFGAEAPKKKDEGNENNGGGKRNVTPPPAEK